MSTPTIFFQPTISSTKVLKSACPLSAAISSLNSSRIIDELAISIDTAAVIALQAEFSSFKTNIEDVLTRADTQLVATRTAISYYNGTTGDQLSTMTAATAAVASDVSQGSSQTTVIQGQIDALTSNVNRYTDSLQLTITQQDLGISSSLASCATLKAGNITRDAAIASIVSNDVALSAGVATNLASVVALTADNVTQNVALSTEIARAIAIESIIQGSMVQQAVGIGANIIAISALQDSNVTRDAVINAEVTRAVAADSTIIGRQDSQAISIIANMSAIEVLQITNVSRNASITAEVTRATAAESSILQQVTSATASIATISTTTDAAILSIASLTASKIADEILIGKNTTNLTAEIARATAAETSEVARALAAEAVLKASANSITGILYQNGNAVLDTISDGDSTYVGILAGNSLKSSPHNVAVGANALTLVTSFGGQNSALGQGAMRSSTAGSYNCAVGCNALYQNTTGSQNCGVGRNTLAGTTTQSDCTAIGHLAGQSSAQNGNTFVGSGADCDAGYSNVTCIGYQAKCFLSNCIQLGNNSVTRVMTAGIFSDANTQDTTLNGSWVGAFSNAPGSVRVHRVANLVTVSLGYFGGTLINNGTQGQFSEALPTWARPSHRCDNATVVIDSGISAMGNIIITGPTILLTTIGNKNWNYSGSGYCGLSNTATCSYLV